MLPFLWMWPGIIPILHWSGCSKKKMKRECSEEKKKVWCTQHNRPTHNSWNVGIGNVYTVQWIVPVCVQGQIFFYNINTFLHQHSQAHHNCPQILPHTIKTCFTLVLSICIQYFYQCQYSLLKSWGCPFKTFFFYHRFYPSYMRMDHAGAIGVKDLE